MQAIYDKVCRRSDEPRVSSEWTGYAKNRIAFWCQKQYIKAWMELTILM